MERSAIDRPAVRIGFPYFAALFAAAFFGAAYSAWLSVLLFITVLILLLLRRYNPNPNVLLSLFSAAAAFAVFSVMTHLTVLPAERYANSTYPVSGTILAPLSQNHGRFYYKMRVTHIDEPAQDTDFVVRISHSEALPAEVGDTVSCEVRFSLPDDASGLSSRASLLANNIVLSAYVTDYASVQVTPAAQQPFQYYVNHVRQFFRSRIFENYPKEESAVLSAMLLGLRDDIEDDLHLSYRLAGASHILAISGMHMAVLSQFSLALFALLRIKRRPAAALSAAVTVLFMFVSGFSASVVRSGIMQLILLIGILLGRKADPFNSLAIAVLGMGIANPFCAGDVSLLFSFSATFGILVLAPRITARCVRNIRDSKRKSRAARLLSPVSTSAAAVLCTAPLQLYLYGTVQFVSILTSLLVLYVSAWLLRFGLLAVLLLSVPGLAPCAQPFVFLSGLCAKLQNSIIRWIAQHIPGTLRIAGNYLPAAVLICGVFFVLSFWLFKNKSKVLPCVLTVCILLCAMGASAFLQRGCTQLLIYDGAYASCTAIIHDGTADVLTCSGDASAVEAALWACGTESLDLLHVQPDESSIRCAETLAERFGAKRLLMPDTVYSTAENAVYYDFNAAYPLSNGGTLSVTDGGATLSFVISGTEIHLETRRSLSLPADADILVTEKTHSAVHAPFTILKTDAIIENSTDVLSPGTYFFTGITPYTRLVFSSDGRYRIYGELHV